MSPIEKPGNGHSGAASQGGPAKPSFMQGAAQATQSYAADQAKRDADAAKYYRFWLKKGESAQITFLDGALNAQGLLEPGGGFYYEHYVQLTPTKGEEFVCMAELEGFCPLCAADNKRSYVAYFTVIDHRSYTGARGTRVDTKKLYPAKAGTYEKLQVRAAKNPTGLVGLTMSVLRSTGEFSPRVGDDFEIDQVRMLPEIHKAYPNSGVDVVTDYSMQIVPIPGVDLLGRGIGVAQTGNGLQSSGANAAGPPAAAVPNPSEVPF